MTWKSSQEKQFGIEKLDAFRAEKNQTKVPLKALSSPNEMLFLGLAARISYHHRIYSPRLIHRTIILGIQLKMLCGYNSRLIYQNILFAIKTKI